MKKQENINQLVEEFRSVADFLLVYLEEAHPIEGWTPSSSFHIKYVHEAKTLDDRIEAVKNLSECNITYPIVLDGTDNEAALAYGSVPDRLYIILDGVVVYVGGFGPIGYKPEEVKNWLTEFTNKSR